MTTRIRNPNPTLESVIRSIIGPRLSARVAKSAHADSVSFERKWRALVNQGMALR